MYIVGHDGDYTTLSLPGYSPVAGGRIVGFLPLPMVLAPCEMQRTSSRVWTRIAVSISCDDNRYTRGDSMSKLECKKKKIDRTGAVIYKEERQAKRKWNQWPAFESWTKQFPFHFPLMILGIQESLSSQHIYG